MQCPHCRRNVKYKERSNRRCGRCKSQFVFEPRNNPMRLTDLRFRAMTERVSDHGKLFYTPEQLVLYVARKARVWRRGSWQTNFWNYIGYAIAVVTILVLVFAGVRGFATGGVDGAGAAMQEIVDAVAETGELAFLIWMSVIFGVISGGKLVLRWIGLFGGDGRLSPVQEQDLLHHAESRWQDVYGTPPPGLLSRDDRIEQWTKAPATIHAVLACPDLPVLRCLHANGVNDSLGLALIPVPPMSTTGEQATLDVLHREPAIPLLLLHDASIEGCLLVETVREILGVAAKHRLIDIGLRPRDVVKHRWLTFHERPSDESLQRLRELAATEEQPSMKSVVRLDAEELKWLEAGNYSPARALTPKQLIGLVTRAVERATRAAPRPTDEARAEQQAKVLGFLTWPEA